MKIDYIKVGYLRCNCYLLERGSECLLIDPGDDISAILDFISGKNVIGILVTHSHFDHVASVSDLVNKFSIPVYDLNNLEEGRADIGNFSFEVIKTFGHTMDSVTYYFKSDKVMFTGDFLFKGTIGRCDLVESRYGEMLKSIDKIKKYDDDIKVYPGHGVFTNLGYEKRSNPYFR